MGSLAERTVWVLLAGILAGGLAACRVADTAPKPGSTSDPAALAEFAISTTAGAASMGDISAGVAFLPPGAPQSFAARVLQAASFVRTAHAAGMVCLPATWGTPTATTVTYLPPTCQWTLPDASTATSSWTGGPWLLTFGGGCAAAAGFLVDSGCAANSTVTRTTVAAIDRVALAGIHVYDLTQNTSAGAGFATGNTHSGGVTVTCVSACPASGSATGTRSIDMLGTHITGSIDGSAHWDATVYTTTPVVVDGTGSGRVIKSGVIVTEHNLAKVTTTTTLNGPMTHQAGCPFPVSGSAASAISGGAANGKTETVAFGTTCGEVTVTNPDGSTTKVHLRHVL
jgi:hypothetical protein